MKRLVLIAIIYALFMTSCSHENEGTGSQSSNVEKDISEDEKAINTLTDIYNNEIIGLWKHYKTIYAKGGSMIERDNSFIEIKQEGKFESNRYNGSWFLSFCEDSVGFGTLLTMVRDYQSDEAKLITYKIQKTIENNTTYLILNDLRDGKQHYLIRQQ